MNEKMSPDESTNAPDQIAHEWENQQTRNKRKNYFCYFLAFVLGLLIPPEILGIFLSIAWDDQQIIEILFPMTMAIILLITILVNCCNQSNKQGIWLSIFLAIGLEILTLASLCGRR